MNPEPRIVRSLLRTVGRGPLRPCYIERVDPRLRIVTAMALSVVIAAAGDLSPVFLALGAVALGWAMSGCPLQATLRRLLPLNALMLLLLVLLPLTASGTLLWRFGPLRFSREGACLAAEIALKGNAIVLVLLVLLGSLEATTLGHALSHLRVPDKLTHLLLFTVRYLEVLHREYVRLRAAMKVRGFRPGMDRHTYRSFGYLLGMLLVRSFDRSERIVAAMKCRGFRGRFHLLDHFAFSRHDVPFCLASAALLGLLLAVMCT